MARNISRFKRNVSITTGSNKQRASVDIYKHTARVVREQAKTINKMLDKLQKEGYDGTWASKILYNRLDIPKLDLINDETGLLKIDKIKADLGVVKLTNIRRALTNFQKSKTATVKGIKNRVNKERQHLLEETGNAQFVKSLTDDEIGHIYEVFNDNDYKTITESGDYESDEVFDFITNAIETKQGIRSFIDTIKDYSVDIPDVEKRKAFRNIYNKYVKNR